MSCAVCGGDPCASETFCAETRKAEAAAMAAAAWNAPGWGEAAAEYRRKRDSKQSGTNLVAGRDFDETCELADRRLAADRKAGRRVESDSTVRARQLLAGNASFERTYGLINDPCLRPTPQVTIDTVVYAVLARGLAALREPAILRILHVCDESARTKINDSIAALIAQKRIAA
jgi:hypothetical protein